ncbi:putative sensor histidine kinase/response regulator TcsB/Sln1 [Aspergillus fischeri NRRL 181]|uniref:histidine kinase n=1 Tax=Neosartorya fischeri (strain ATCC 1020 / DSM 3700 / CBS 544.65 / FGSC A1164 / JCM 1740 / NRRL 181 / WB 181) TaxID=331117 RepID=A1CYA8_NEOFI|nr:osmolarity two-component system protein sln1 [Aspergillus fischeri NRRL 181]EAW23728.1 osmolarity two-component system protein sln1 [Aspergillus fischeri NRRL 181]
MRIPIAVQLGLLVLVTALVGLAVLSIATWVNNYNFVVDVQSEGLELVAKIKASQIASNLKLLESTCKTIVTRLLIQGALGRFYNGNSSDSNWTSSVTDVQSAMGSNNYLDLYQAIIFSRDGQGDQHGLLNVTAKDIVDIPLPYTYPNGTPVMLGDEGLGYPPALYPNLTYSAASDGSTTTDVYAFSDYKLGLDTSLLLGPLPINSSFSLVSVTVPIINNTSATDILGYMTVVASAANLQATINSRDGLGHTAQILLLGPSRAANQFAPDAYPATATSAPNVEGLSHAEVHYVFEPTPLPGQSSRHGGNLSMNSFALSRYPLAWKLLSKPWAESNDTISDLSTRNEHGYQVAVGAIRPKTPMAQWILLVEQTQAEAFAPINKLRKIILACVFGTIGFIILIVPPLTHLAVAPIRRLSEATRKSIEPPSQPPHNCPPSSGPYIVGTAEMETEPRTFDDHMDEKGFVAWVKHFRRKDRPNSAHSNGSHNHARAFQIPGRVKERKHLITDELTELTSTFNEMSDELSIHYHRLEERVAERTRELEAAKLAAETANESKTLFIANISHELKTPLNGILGMCAVCMGEDDLPRIKKSLQVVYKSGDLLLHLLNDLLTFSKNQIDQAIRLEEREFRLSDIRSQLAVIFQNQVQEKHIDFNVNFISGDTLPPKGDGFQEKTFLPAGPALGPPGTGRLRDMVLWGDQHRILQVLINLVSNSLKFTPEHGKVEVRIKCIREAETPGSPRTSLQDSRRNSRLRSRPPSHASSQPRDPVDGLVQEEYPTPVLSQLRTLIFQFEVEDNGPGVALHLQKRVFEPFVQGDLGLNRKYGGTGLGLSICAQLSRLMNGKITLESEPGKGALFTVEIPLKFVKEAAPSTRSSSAAGSRTPSVFSLDDLPGLARPPSNNGSVRSDPLTNFEKQDLQPRLVGLSQPFFTPTPSSPAPSTPRAPPADGAKPEVKDSTSGKVRVLVAEDNVVNQEVVLRMLRLEEVYDVTVVKDGQEAYDTVKANMEEGKVFDLIFMDIQMPNLDGLESTRLIRGMGYSAPIVALSAFSEESNIKDCMDSGMDMFISKPIRRPALKQVLNKFATIPEEPENVQDS